MTKAQKQQQKKRRVRAAILIVIVLAVVTTVCVLALHKGYDHFSKTVYPLPYREYVEKYAAEYGEDPSLVYAVMSTESSFDAEAVSSAGAMGLMQLTDKTFEWAQMRMGTQDKGLTDDDLLSRRSATYSFRSFRFLICLKERQVTTWRWQQVRQLYLTALSNTLQKTSRLRSPMF